MDEAADAISGAPTNNQTLFKLAATLFKSARAKAIDRLSQATGVSADNLVTVTATSGGVLLLAVFVWLVWYIKKHQAMLVAVLTGADDPEEEEEGEVGRLEPGRGCVCCFACVELQPGGGASTETGHTEHRQPQQSGLARCCC